MDDELISGVKIVIVKYCGKFKKSIHMRDGIKNGDKVSVGVSARESERLGVEAG